MATIDSNDGFQILYGDCIGQSGNNDFFTTTKEFMSLVFGLVEVLIPFRVVDDFRIEILSDIKINHNTIYKFSNGDDVKVCRLKHVSDKLYDIVSSSDIVLANYNKLEIYIPDHKFRDLVIDDTAKTHTYRTVDDYTVVMTTTNQSIQQKLSFETKTVNVNSATNINLSNTNRVISIMLINRSSIISYYTSTSYNTLNNEYTYISSITSNQNGVVVVSNRMNNASNDGVINSQDYRIGGIYRYNKLFQYSVGYLFGKRQDSNYNTVGIIPSTLYGDVCDGIYHIIGNWNTNPNGEYLYNDKMYMMPNNYGAMYKLWDV